MELAYAGLQQFCAPFLSAVERLPSPHRDALAVAFGLQAGAAPDRFMVGLAVLGLLSEAAEEQPLMCLVDDAQWLDEVSVQALAFVARRLLAEPVALVFAVRGSGDGGRIAGLKELVIRGLDDADARALLDEVIKGPVDELVRERLIAETRGNPLALVELPRGLTPEQLAGGFALPDSLPVATGIEETFRHRLVALAPDTRRLLLVAAADPFGDVAVLWGAAERLGIGAGAAAEAEAAGLMEIGSWVRFRHPLVRSAVYRSAASVDRQRVHRALAEVIDGLHEPERRAWHRAQAVGRADEAVAAELESSAERARARGGAAAAAAFLERAASLSPDPVRRAERALAAATAKRDAGALNAATALLVTVEHGPPDARRAAEASRLRGHLALDLQRGAEASRLLLAAAEALEPVDVARARQTHLEALAAAMWSDGLDDTSVLTAVAQAARAAPRALDPPRPMDVVLDALAVRFTEGFAAAAPLLLRALEVVQRERVDITAGHWLWTAGNNVSGIMAMELFDSEARHALGVEQVEAARASGALVQLPVGLHYLAHTNLPAGELALAAAQIDESCAITDATGNPPVAYTELALAAFQGREREAVELIDETIRTATANGQGRIVSFATYASAVLYNGIGRYEAARDAAWRVLKRNVIGYSSLVVAELAEAASRTSDHGLLEQARAWIDERTPATRTAWATGIATRIGALSSDGDDADRLYRESISHLGATRLRAELARGHLLYGEWLRRERRRVDARGQLVIAHDMLGAMGLEGFARRAARELLATGATARKRTVATREDLTAQETQIARLATQGLTNPEIGARLFLSPRTVEYHLRKVFTKLGIRSRAQLSAALAEHDQAAQSI